MLINNSLYTYDINIEFDYIGDFLLGNSIVNISMLYVCSFTFGFCNWHRHIIIANLINIIIATIDKVFHLPATDIKLLSSYYVVAGVLFPNLTEEQLDEKIIHSAINFWFEDEDAGSGKVWNYFKNI